MLANTFSHGLIRDYVISFGTLFNNIKINRRAASGEDESTIAVPLTYAPQQRYIARINEDLALDKPVAITLPRMSFEMAGMTYASERKLNTINKIYKAKPLSANTQLYSSYAPVPYDFSFQLSIYTGNIEDGTHIIEQILPYFTPEFTVTLKSVSDLELNLDLPVILTSVTSEDTYEGGFEERRLITWTLDFTLKGNLLGYVKDIGIINKASINFRPGANTLAANSYDQIVTRPAMFANGSPITTATAVTSSVDPDQISANSNFGISTTTINFLGD